jgi:hypothetical protein
MYHPPHYPWFYTLLCHYSFQFSLEQRYRLTARDIKNGLLNKLRQTLFTQLCQNV